MALNDSLYLYKRCIIYAITVSVECIVFFIKVQVIENTCTDFDS